MGDSVAAFRRDMLELRGLAPRIADEPGVSVVAVESRLGSGVASGYVYGRHFVILTDPALADRISGFDPGAFAADSFAPANKFGAEMVAAGAEVLGSGAMRILPGGPPEPVDGVVIFDRDVPGDVARIQALVDACTDDEIDQAAIEMDELDPIICGIEASPGGPMIAYASAFGDEDLGGRWDIGVLTHPDHRHGGLGARVAQRLVHDLVTHGRVPIYRYDLDNTVSAALSESLGFVVATTLLAVRFPA